MTRQMADDEVLRVLAAVASDYRRHAENMDTPELADLKANEAAKAETVTAVHAAVAALQAERDALRTMAIAAAEEISAHWPAHCDAEGYGPANLLRRLEGGIAAEYGYTAGAFAELKQRAERAESALEALRGQVEGLVKRWRKIADERGVVQFTGNDHALFANELNALLAIKEGMG